jgi:hypothetical protein
MDGGASIASPPVSSDLINAANTGNEEKETRRESSVLKQCSGSIFKRRSTRGIRIGKQVRAAKKWAALQRPECVDFRLYARKLKNFLSGAAIHAEAYVRIRTPLRLRATARAWTGSFDRKILMRVNRART